MFSSRWQYSSGVCFLFSAQLLCLGSVQFPPPPTLTQRLQGPLNSLVLVGSQGVPQGWGVVVGTAHHCWRDGRGSWALPPFLELLGFLAPPRLLPPLGHCSLSSATSMKSNPPTHRCTDMRIPSLLTCCAEGPLLSYGRPTDCKLKRDRECLRLRDADLILKHC